MPVPGISVDTMMNLTFQRSIYHWMTNVWCDVNQFYIPMFGLCRFISEGNESVDNGGGTGEFDQSDAGGWLEYILMLRIDLGAWFCNGAFSSVGGITGSAATQICNITLGRENCERVQQLLIFTTAVLLLACLIYGLEWICRPLVYAISRTYRLYRKAGPIEVNLTHSNVTGKFSEGDGLVSNCSKSEKRCDIITFKFHKHSKLKNAKGQVCTLLPGPSRKRKETKQRKHHHKQYWR